MLATDRIRFDQPRAGVQRLAARFGGHAYDLHRHETITNLNGERRALRRIGETGDELPAGIADQRKATGE